MRSHIIWSDGTDKNAVGVQSCKNVPTVPTSWCYFFWPVLIFGKNTRKHAKNRRFFGANFLGGENWSVLIFTPFATMPGWDFKVI